MLANEESPISSKTVTAWTEGETRLLLDKYASYLPGIGPFKQLKTKKDMWMKIGAEFNGKSWKQCEKRYKTIMKRKKVAVGNSRTSGAKPQKLQFEEELEKICKIDDSIEPAVKISSQCMIKKEVAAKEKQRKRKTLPDTMLEIAARQEGAREKRHKERMEKAARIESLLEKCISENKPA
ncbi:uncharacterized protein LOC128869306 [Anastrepha ludens]|uniref:uncharacterized protein LOC128869306 n=1 Tax=Anastrepha ludens TaxID=28586 RepID=UPI0023AEE90C|nr:uncharacterized protein LOC128869306 [Anastrepha ludens]